MAVILCALGGVLDSTPVTKPVVHAEMVTNLVNPKSQTYSCQRRQLRTSCLNPSVVPSDWSRAYASRVLILSGSRTFRCHIS